MTASSERDLTSDAGGVMPEARILADLDRLPTFPTAVAQVLQLTSRPETSAAEIAAAIATDPVLTARLLRVVNSAYFGFPQRISTLHQAVVILGMQAVRLLTISAAAAEFSQQLPLPEGIELDSFWTHSAAVASSTGDIARTLVDCRWDEALVSGLLHDIGIIVMACSIPEQYSEVLEYATQARCHLVTAEQRMLQTDHTRIGSAVGSYWGLPEPLVYAIRFHHSPADAGPHGALAAAVHVANAVTVGAGSRICPATCSTYVNPDVWGLLGGLTTGVGPDELRRFSFYLQNNMEKIQDLMARMIAA